MSEECPFKYDSKKLELLSEIKRRRKLSIVVNYPMICNLVKYSMNCVGEDKCPIMKK